MTDGLVVRGLRVGFVSARGVVSVVHGVDLDVVPGQTVGLAGASGCGKSTVVQALGRTLPPPGVVLGGRVALGGVDLLRASPSEVRALRWTRLALVPQAAQACLNPLLTVQAHLFETLRAHGRAAEISVAEERLAWVELGPEVLGRYPHELSGGMRQRVALALALLLEPTLVVLDEPTTALDPLVEEAILTRVRALQQRLGFGLLVVSHDVSLLASLADELVVLEAGRVVERAARGSTADGPARRLLAAVPRVDTAREPSLTPRAPAGDTALEVADLSWGYPAGPWPWSPSRPVLQGVSLTVRRGEVVALVGASGSGKTTLAHVVARLLRPAPGQVRVGGQDATGLSERAYRRAVQLVLQDPYASLNPSRTVRQHLLGPLATHRGLVGRAAEDAAAALLASVGLGGGEDWLDRRPHGLSGGQRQRVALARALAADPVVLVLDEPTSMLDAALRRELLVLLAQVRDTHRVAMLVVTHDLASARHLADRVVVLDGGRVVEEGPCDRVLARPEAAATRSLVRAAARVLPAGAP